MGRQTKSNLPQDAPLRWNVEKAAQEFGLSIMTLRKALAKASATPDGDNLYSTSQLASSIFGTLHMEKLATQRELTRKHRISNQIAESEFLSRTELAKGLALIADSMRNIIETSGLSRTAQEDLFRALSSVPLVLSETAARQSRLRRNGTDDGEDSKSFDGVRVNPGAEQTPWN